MAELTFSAEEAVFIFLSRSHGLLCDALQGHVKNEMRARYPLDWTTRISSLFSRGTRNHIQKKLDAGEAIRDIFTVCKVIRCHLRSVFCLRAKKAGQVITDFRATDYLNSALDVVETTRHWAFHGKGVSPEEVASCLAYSVLLVEIMNRSRAGESNCTELPLVALRRLRTSFLDFLSGQTRDGFQVSANEAAMALLWGCFAHLEENLQRILARSVLGEGRVGLSAEGHSIDHGGLNNLLRFLKGNHQKAAVSQFKAPNIKANVGSICLTLMQLRNNMVHNGQLLLMEIRDDLERSLPMWRVFGLEKCHALGVIEFISCTARRIEGDVVESPSSVRINTLSAQLWKAVSSRRAAISVDDVFVGRSTELSETIAFLVDETCTHANKLVLIDGVSGVGKTAFARRSLVALFSYCSRQLWLSASTLDILASDLQLQLSLSSGQSASQEHKINTAGVSHIQLASAANKCLQRLSKHVIVLDDVTCITGNLVARIFRNTQHLVVVTLCHRSVLPHEDIKEVFAAIHHVPLTCLKTDMSLKIVESRGISIQENEQLLCTIVEKDLGNLPLAINIFSCLVKRLLSDMQELKRSAANGSPAGEGDGLRRRNGHLENLAREVNCKKKSEMLSSVLASIQERVGYEVSKTDGHNVDRYHTRGLSGLVSIALQSLLQQPSAFCLLLILALCGTGRLLIEAFNSTDVSDILHSELDINDQAEDEMCIVSAVDALFMSTLDIFGQAKEQLLQCGLVFCVEPEQVLQMHQLLQICISQEVLSKPLCYAEWVKVSSETMKYLLMATFAENQLATPTLLAYCITLSSSTGRLCFGQTLGNAYDLLKSCKFRRCPISLKWQLPLLRCLLGCIDGSDYVHQQTVFYATEFVLNARFCSPAFVAYTISQQRRSQAFLNQYLIPGRAQEMCFFKVLFRNVWPKHAPPMDIISFLGTYNLAVQTTKVATALPPTDEDKEMLVRIGELVQVLQNAPRSPSTFQKLTLVCNQLLVKPPSRGVLEDVRAQVNRLRKLLSEGTQSGLTAADFLHLSALEVTCYMLTGSFDNVACQLLGEESNILPGSNLQRSSKLSFCCSKKQAHSDLLLVGAIAFAVVGFNLKAQEWAKRVLDKSIAEHPHCQKHITVALRLLAYVALIMDDIACCISFLETSILSSCFELQIRPVGKVRLEMFLHQLVTSLESVQMLTLLGIMFGRNSFGRNLQQGLQAEQLIEKCQFSLAPACMVKLILQAIRGRTADVFFNQKHIAGDLIKFGMYYRLARCYSLRRRESKSRFLHLQCVRCWVQMFLGCRELADTEIPEVRVMMTLLAHTLKALGKQYEVQGRLHPAAWFYARTCRLEDLLFITEHACRQATQKALVHVLRLRLFQGLSPDTEQFERHSTVVQFEP